MKTETLSILEKVKNVELTTQVAQEQLFVLFGVSVSLPFISKGEWVFERSSGYAGYRCKKCHTWIYENQEKKCDCDFLQ